MVQETYIITTKQLFTRGKKLQLWAHSRKVCLCMHYSDTPTYQQLGIYDLVEMEPSCSCDYK